MRMVDLSLRLALVAVLGVSAVGCGAETTEETQPIEIEGPPPVIDDAHAHHDEGPHGGHLIELGRSHAFHAEIVEGDDARQVTVYILGSELELVPIEQPTITLSLVVDGKAQAFELQANDPVEGRSSSFVANDANLYETLHAPGVTGKLLVAIDGKSYSGAVGAHDHDH
ncbi:hypothetical protein [Candidatus Laterigemmans baculatus]|uniref:hypothetical protein n=1 Tax=Candidatus Laterigemmans baculatus TaxID=2770505 RepID=UPI0013DA2923|nr:hypothetical protein [Candidatus Laterigemmans baculatus]